MRLHFPYSPLHISGDGQGNVQRQAEADRINRTTDRTVDAAEVVEAFGKLVAHLDAPEEPPCS